MRAKENDSFTSGRQHSSHPKSEPSPQQALQDIEFIKQFITRNQEKLDQSPPYLFIWGMYMVLGFLGMQFSLKLWPMWFWPCGAVIGGVFSAIIGMKQSRRTGVREGGAYGWMFWLPFAMVFVIGFFMMAADIVRMEFASILWLMLIGLSYVCLGMLLGKGPIILGIWFIALGTLTRMFFLEYQFMIFGLLGGGSIVVTGFILQQRRKRYG